MEATRRTEISRQASPRSLARTTGAVSAGPNQNRRNRTATAAARGPSPVVMAGTLDTVADSRHQPSGNLWTGSSRLPVGVAREHPLDAAAAHRSRPDARSTGRSVCRQPGVPGGWLL